ncbi:LysE family translocator [Proteobacteria bacterium 005FR1]|nr:LysE family translocator [Proteobacteria bacterium 005FR1]
MIELTGLFEKLLPLFGFVFASTITPGPNNLMLAASGKRFGYRRTLPHLTGIVVGVTGLHIACMFGLGEVVADSAAMTTGLKLFASAYLVYLIVQLASAPPAKGEQQEEGRPLNIAQAALFQLINPKAWIMAITSIALLSGVALTATEKIVVLFFAFLFIGVSCNHLWLLSGISIRRYLASTAGRWAFNSVVGALTVYAVVSIWYG